MDNKIFAACALIMIVLGTGIFYYRTQPVSLEAVFSVGLTVLADGSRINGTGYFYNDINFSVLKWPAFGRDKVDLSLQYSENRTRTSPVKFDILLYLNQTQKVIEIHNLKNVGNYMGTINCCFDGVKSGSYNLTINLQVDGVTDEMDKTESSLFVP
jgi:hypothetical protein